VAAQGARDEESGLLAEINVTPLVDITLVLLIIFMVAAPLIASTPSIKLDLPRAATADDAQPSTLTVTLQRDSSRPYRLYVNGREGDLQLLAEATTSLLARDQNLQAVIAADEGIPYGEVIHVLDLMKGKGVRKVALDTRQER
jgi:biopolymer transport protein ExbD